MGIKIALSAITKYIDDIHPYIDFLSNAGKYGHEIDTLIIGYSHGYEQAVIENLQRYIKVETVKVSIDDDLLGQLDSMGIDRSSSMEVLDSPIFDRYGLISYGLYRNTVLLKAIVEKVDILFFIDTDVYPKVLLDYNFDTEKANFEDVDFFGMHLKYLLNKDVYITTSDYSGYYIIPPIQFYGFDKLLAGVGKQEAIEYMKRCKQHKCLNFDKGYNRQARKTNKILGGNMAINLSEGFPPHPFYSTLLKFEDEFYLGRGEDTLLGYTVSGKYGAVIDIDMKIFHNTFGNFPEVPDITQKSIRDRLYFACMGWIARNPFLYWFLKQQGILKTDVNKILLEQKNALKEAGLKVAEHLNDDRFEKLYQALQQSEEQLKDSIKRYIAISKSWNKIIRAIEQNGRRNVV
ncbi:MAG: hypothetical protein PHP06_10310 [Clostridia bacterium]|nr:hypothetical protein [Clostridia bacterium]